MDEAASIAEFPDCRDSAIAGAASAPIWPALRGAMAAETARWPRIAPPDAAFVVLPLAALRDLAARPDCADVLAALADEEARRLAAFRFPKRRLEWLGGRLAAKAALLELLDTNAEPASLVIENDEHGRPVVPDSYLPSPPRRRGGGVGVGGAFAAAQAANSPSDAGGISPHPDPLPTSWGEGVHLSITHSGDFAAALAAPRPCGLDVQEIRPNLARVRDYFADADEIALGGEDAENAWLARVWAAKEAIKKCRYPDAPTFMERIKITGRDGETLLCRLADTDAPLPVQTALHQGYAVACCLEQPEPAAITKNA